jgi:hypothetical protein
MVVALLALFVALDGPAIAARLIDGRSIKRNSITHQQIRNGTIGSQDLSKAALKALRATAPGSIGANQLAANAVDASKLADGAAGPAQLAQNAVTSSKLAVGAVGATAVADGGLQTRDLGDFSGSVSVDYAPFLPNTCQVAKDIVPQPSAAGQGNVIADDVVSVSPGTGWPDPIVVSANPGAGNTLRIVACRVGGDPAAEPIDPGRTTFEYVGFDAP